MSALLTHTETALREAAQRAVEHAARRGARARVSVQHEGFAKIAVRGGEIEASERSGSQGLSITLFHEGRRGMASTAGLDRAAIERVVDEGLLIAAHVQPDPDGDLPPPEWLAFSGPLPRLYAEGPRSIETLRAAALAIDAAAAAAAAADPGRLRAGEAVAVAREGLWALATTDGFCRSIRRSNDGRWSVMLAQDEHGSTSDFCQSQERSVEALLPAELLAQQAAARARAALGAQSVGSRRSPVLFEARTATTLVGDLAAALTGGAQHRRTSFLPDPIGRTIAAPHLTLTEDPFEPLGLASGGFDSEGIAGAARDILRDGVAMNLFLSSFTARRLGLRPSGNADGFYNLRLTSSAPSGDAAAMRRMLGTGLLVTGFQGGSTDPASGNFARAVQGLWIERGEVAHAVRDVTIAGMLPAMLTNIRAVGLDVAREGAIRTGSILIDELQIGGRA